MLPIVVFQDKEWGATLQSSLSDPKIPNRRDSDEENGILWGTLHAFNRFMF